MSRRAPLSLFQLERFEKTLRTGSRERRRRVLDRLRETLKIPPDARGTPDLLSRLLPEELNNLQGCPLVAAALLRMRTDGPDYLLWRLEEEPSAEWASRVLAEALPTLPPRRFRWVRGCYLHGNLPISSSLTPLLALLPHPDRSLRRTVARLLREAGISPVPPGADLLRLADDPEPEVRELAQVWMAKAGAAYFERLHADLRSATRSSRPWIASLLTGPARKLAQALPDLVVLGYSPLREHPATLLRELQEATYAIVPSLLEAAGSRDPQRSGEAAGSLVANWRSLTRHRAEFERLLKSKREHVRANAIQLLPLCTGALPDALPSLRRALEEESPGIALAALNVLRREGAVAPSDHPRLLARMARWPLPEGLQGALLLGADDAAVLPFLLKGLRHADMDTRRSAVREIGRLKTLTPERLRDLRQALADGDPNVRMEALWALERRSDRFRRDAPRIRALMQVPCWKGNSARYWRRRLRRWVPDRVD